jgi:hypothetical protein
MSELTPTIYLSDTSDRALFDRIADELQVFDQEKSMDTPPNP